MLALLMLNQIKYSTSPKLYRTLKYQRVRNHPKNGAKHPRGQESKNDSRQVSTGDEMEITD